MNNIILVGFMGSGKSSIAKALALKNDTFYIDTDILIESKIGKSINEIFKDIGEEFFRDEERKVTSWINEHIDNGIIATGGGLPIFASQIKECGKVIFIDVAFETLKNRISIKEESKRPLFSTPDLKELFTQRRKIYEEISDFIIDGDKELDVVINQISTLLHQH